jgi:hypothetical protein
MVDYFDLYKDKSGAFQTSLIVLLAFSLIFLFIILLPYVLVLDRQEEVNNQLSNQTANLTMHNNRLQAYEDLQESSRLIRITLINEPNQLLDYDRMIANERKDGRLYIDECSSRHNLFETDWKHCKMISNVQSYMRGTLNIIDRNVTRPFIILFAGQNVSNYRTLDDYAQVHGVDYVNFHPEVFLYYNLNVTKLKNDIERLYSDYEKIIAYDASVVNASSEYRQKAMNEMERITYEFFKNRQDLYTYGNEYRESVQPVLEALNANITSLEQELQGLEAKKTEISTLVGSVESPFGKVPVGLREAIALFPILLASGLVACSSLLIRAIRLRIEYHKQLLSEANATKKSAKKKAMLAAPLWVDPFDRRMFGFLNILKFSVLFIPLFTFIAAVYVIYTESLLIDAFPRTEMVTNNAYLYIYTSIYSLGAVFFFGGYVYLFKQYKLYKDQIGPVF